MAHPANKTGTNTSCNCVLKTDSLKQSMASHCYTQLPSDQDIIACNTEKPAKLNMVPSHSSRTCMCYPCHTRSLHMMRYLASCMSHVQNILSTEALFNCHGNFPGYTSLQCGNHSHNCRCVESQTAVSEACLTKPQTCSHFAQTYPLNPRVMEKPCNCKSHSVSTDSVTSTEYQIKKETDKDNVSYQFASAVNTQCQCFNNLSCNYLPSHPSKTEPKSCSTQTIENQSVCKKCVATDTETTIIGPPLQNENIVLNVCEKQSKDNVHKIYNETQEYDESKSEQIAVHSIENEDISLVSHKYDNEAQDDAKSVYTLFESSKRSTSNVGLRKNEEPPAGSRSSEIKMNAINETEYLNETKKINVSKDSVSLTIVKENESKLLKTRKANSDMSLTSNIDVCTKVANMSQASGDDSGNSYEQELLANATPKMWENNLQKEEKDPANSEHDTIKIKEENHISQTPDENFNDDTQCINKERPDKMTKTSSIETVSDLKTQVLKATDTENKISTELAAEKLCAVLLTRVHSCVCQDYSVLFNELGITPIKRKITTGDKISGCAPSETINVNISLETPIETVDRSICTDKSENGKLTENNEGSVPKTDENCCPRLIENKTVIEECLSNDEVDKSTENINGKIELLTDIVNSSTSFASISETKHADENQVEHQEPVAKSSSENFSDASSNLYTVQAKDDQRESEIILEGDNYETENSICSVETCGEDEEEENGNEEEENDNEEEENDNEKVDNVKLEEKVENQKPPIAVQVSSAYDEACDTHSNYSNESDENFDHLIGDDSDHDDIDELLRRCEIFKQFERSPAIKETSSKDSGCSFKYLPDISEEVETEFEDVTEDSFSNSLKNTDHLVSGFDLDIFTNNTNERMYSDTLYSTYLNTTKESKSQMLLETGTEETSCIKNCKSQMRLETVMEETSDIKNRSDSKSILLNNYDSSLQIENRSRTSVNTDEYKSTASDETNSCNNHFLSLESIPRSLTYIDDNDMSYQETVAMPGKNELWEDCSEKYLNACDSNLDNQNKSKVKNVKSDLNPSVRISSEIIKRENNAVSEDSKIQSQNESEHLSPIISAYEDRITKNKNIVNKEIGDNVNLSDIKSEEIPERVYMDFSENHKKPQQFEASVSKSNKTVSSLGNIYNREKEKSCNKSVHCSPTAKLKKNDYKTLRDPSQNKPIFSKHK